MSKILIKSIRYGLTYGETNRPAFQKSSPFINENGIHLLNIASRRKPNKPNTKLIEFLFRWNIICINGFAHHKNASTNTLTRGESELYTKLNCKKQKTKQKCIWIVELYTLHSHFNKYFHIHITVKL